MRVVGTGSDRDKNGVEKKRQDGLLTRITLDGLEFRSSFLICLFVSFWMSASWMSVLTSRMGHDHHPGCFRRLFLL